MLREELRLAIHDLGGMSLERFGDLPMQLLPGVAQQAATSRFLHQRVLEAIDHVRWGAALNISSEPTSWASEARNSSSESRETACSTG